jgi:hypothetical protein
VSIKIITGATLNNQNMEDFLQEANLMMSLRPHENVILLKGKKKNTTNKQINKQIKKSTKQPSKQSKEKIKK